MKAGLHTVLPSSSIGSALVLGLFNQAVVSIGGFGWNLALARGLPADEYGVIALITAIILYLNGLHQALITYPLSLDAASGDSREFSRSRIVAALSTLLFQFVCIPAVVIVTARNAPLKALPLALVALFFWQIQEINRRSALARGLYLEATCGDAVRYLGAFAVAAILAVNGLLSVQAAFLVVALASALALLATPSTAFSWVRFGPLNFAAEIKSYWRRGSPVLWAALLSAFPVTFFLWLLVRKDGLVAGAAFQALLNIAAIARPVAVGIENMLVPEIARRKGTMSFHELVSILWHCAWVSGALIVPVFAVILLAPQWTLGLFYGSDAPYTRFPGELRILIWVYVTYPIAAIFSATLKAYGASEGLMKMQLYPALTAVILGPFLILRMGLLGACLTWLATGLVCTLFGLLYVTRLRRFTSSRGTIRQAV